MSQYKQGLATFTNGSQNVVGNADANWSAVQAGHIVMNAGDGIFYEVGSVSVAAGIYTLHLTAFYVGPTAAGVNYVIQTSFTPIYGIPYMEQGDTQSASIFKRAMLQLDELYNNIVAAENLLPLPNPLQPFTVSNEAGTQWRTADAAYALTLLKMGLDGGPAAHTPTVTSLAAKATKNGEGVTYLVVDVSANDPVINANNAHACNAQAKLITTPNGIARSATNRVVVLFPPARYDFQSTRLFVNTQYIDYMGLTAVPAHVQFTSTYGAGPLSVNKIASDCNILNIAGYPALGTPTQNRTAFVDQFLGNNATAVIGDPNKPFSTGDAAYTAIRTLAAASPSLHHRIHFGLANYTITLAADWLSNIHVSGSSPRGSRLTIYADGGQPNQPAKPATVTTGEGTTGTDGPTGTDGKTIQLWSDWSICLEIYATGGRGANGGEGGDTGEEISQGGLGGTGGKGGTGGYIVINNAIVAMIYAGGGQGGTEGQPGVNVEGAVGNAGTCGDGGQGGDVSLFNCRYDTLEPYSYGTIFTSGGGAGEPEWGGFSGPYGGQGGTIRLTNSSRYDLESTGQFPNGYDGQVYADSSDINQVFIGYVGLGGGNIEMQGCSYVLLNYNTITDVAMDGSLWSSITANTSNNKRFLG